MAFGFGDMGFGILITAAMMVVLWVFPFLEGAIDRSREQVSYDVLFDLKKASKLAEIETALKNFHLQIIKMQHYKKDGAMQCHYTVAGKPAAQEKFVQFLLVDKDIQEFRY